MTGDARSPVSLISMEIEIIESGDVSTRAQVTVWEQGAEPCSLKVAIPFTMSMVYAGPATRGPHPAHL